MAHSPASLPILPGVAGIGYSSFSAYIAKRVRAVVSGTLLPNCFSAWSDL